LKNRVFPEKSAAHRKKEFFLKGLTPPAKLQSLTGKLASNIVWKEFKNSFVENVLRNNFQFNFRLLVKL